MTAFFTRCCKKLKPPAAGLLLALLLFPAGAAAAGIDLRNAALTAGDDGYTLQADFNIALTPTLEDALNRGVSLYFVCEFELIRPRWYWLDDRMIDDSVQFRLSYNTLTRQYRLGAGGFLQNFPTLSEALLFLGHVRRRHIADITALHRGDRYHASVRMRLDSSQLPKPFQLDALGSREWNISSEWFNWEYTP